MISESTSDLFLKPDNHSENESLPIKYIWKNSKKFIIHILAVHIRYTQL